MRRGNFPPKKASNAEKVSIWWRHHVFQVFSVGVTSEIREDELAAISSPPHAYMENWFMIPEFYQLNSYHFTSTVMTQVCEIASVSHPKADLFGKINCYTAQASLLI